MTEIVHYEENYENLSTSFYTQKDDKNLDDFVKKPQIKKVKFERKLDVIEVESYKKYNKDHTYPRNPKYDKKNIHCKCNIY